MVTALCGLGTPVQIVGASFAPSLPSTPSTGSLD